ncbi:MAG: SAM-dependent methyltransferase, partial [Candidatus Puniceispirillaceae bacterium]
LQAIGRFFPIKTGIKPSLTGLKILDIGCGWGGLAFALASVEPGASVTGITLSENQHAYAKTGVEPTPQAKH